MKRLDHTFLMFLAVVYWVCTILWPQRPKSQLNPTTEIITNEFVS